MSFGDKKKQVVIEDKAQKTIEKKALPPQVIEKIIEVPVIKEVEVIKEVIKEVKVPQNTEIPAKYDDAVIEALRKEMLQKHINVNDKLQAIKGKQDNLYKVAVEKSQQYTDIKMSEIDIEQIIEENASLKQKHKDLDDKFDQLLAASKKWALIDLLLGGLVLTSIVIQFI